MQGKMIIISAPSGAGKSTIIKAILDSGMDIEFSVSACSRPMRNGEQDGVHYHFLSVDDFKRRIDNDEFLEWEEVYKNHFYGTLKSELSRIWDKGKTILIEADVYGGVSMKSQYGAQALSIFIRPPGLARLKERLINRSTDKQEHIETRLAKAQEEMDLADKFDTIVVNDDLDTAVREAKAVIQSFLSHE